MGRWEGRQLEVSQNSRITPRGVGFFFGLDSEKKGGKKPHPPGVFSEIPLYGLRIIPFVNRKEARTDRRTHVWMDKLTSRIFNVKVLIFFNVVSYQGGK